MLLSHTSLYHTLRTTLAIAALALALPVSAQWGWKDAKGQRVFSDQAPPSNVADKDVFKRPAGSAAAVVTAAPAAATQVAADTATAAVTPAKPASAASAPKLSGKDAELEKKKKEAEAAETAKKKAADQEQAKAKQDNCDRAKRALAQFSSGVRIATTNDKGEREIMSDTQRASEIKRLEGVAAQDCKAG